MFPWVTPCRRLIGEAIQSAHVSLVELFLVPHLKIVTEVSDVEVCAGALQSEINLIEIANSNIVNHYRDGLAGNRKSCPLHIAPFGTQAGIANDISDGGLSADPDFSWAVRTMRLGGIRNAWLPAPSSTCIS